ncbi:hypothetical protein DY000_02020546 [Brassica cretica]|uniref:Uncharacterized protein n=1 Tax=Brassica cretica TaxID=69181 RepID=A0ABQ7ELA1_BRACR|nr:hypothetical protein DY000_02020546 [Brassica cretica]
MDGSYYQKSSISWKGGRSLGLVPGSLLSGTWSAPLSGIWGPGAFLEAGGNGTGVFFPNMTHLKYGPKKDLRYSFTREIQCLAACVLIYLASLRFSGKMSFSRYQTRGSSKFYPLR